MQQISTEGVQGETRLGRHGDPLGNVKETLMGLLHTNGSPNPGQKTRPHNNQQKKENLQNC